MTEYEVGVKEAGGPDDDFEHVHVDAESPDDAYSKGESESLYWDAYAYQAYDCNEGVTHVRD